LAKAQPQGCGQFAAHHGHEAVIVQDALADLSVDIPLDAVFQTTGTTAYVRTSRSRCRRRWPRRTHETDWGPTQSPNPNSNATLRRAGSPGFPWFSHAGFAQNQWRSFGGRSRCLSNRLTSIQRPVPPKLRQLSHLVKAASAPPS
jgi:hypothetical protein